MSCVVKVTCLAGGVSVFRTEITISDLLHRLDRTKQDNKAILLFISVGNVAENKEPKAPGFMAMFCNGKRCGQDGAKHPTNTSHNETQSTVVKAVGDQSVQAVSQPVTGQPLQADINQIGQVEAPLSEAPHPAPLPVSIDYWQQYEYMMECAKQAEKDDQLATIPINDEEVQEKEGNQSEDFSSIYGPSIITFPLGKDEGQTRWNKDEAAAVNMSVWMRRWRLVLRVVFQAFFGMLVVSVLMVVLEPWLPVIS